LTNWFSGHWEFAYDTTTYINCEVFIPSYSGSPLTGGSIILDIFANDAISGHTASFQVCDASITTGTLQVGSLSCLTAQTFTTTSTAYSRSTLTFNLSAVLTSKSILVVKIGVSPTGTSPTANLIVLPHFAI